MFTYTADFSSLTHYIIKNFELAILSNKVNYELKVK